MKIVSKIMYIIGILAAVAAAVGLRLRAVNMLPTDYDEPVYFHAAQLYSEEIHTGDLTGIMNVDVNMEHPPLFKILYGFVLTAFPPTQELTQAQVDNPLSTTLPQPQGRALRLTSAGVNVLEVLLLAILNPMAGLCLAVHTYSIKYTSQIMLEALPAFTSLVVVAAYLKARKKMNFFLVLSAIFLGLTVASKYMYAIIVVPVLVHWILIWKEGQERIHFKKMIGPVLLWGGIAVVSFFLADPYLWPSPIERLESTISYHFAYAQGAHVAEVGYPWWQPFVYIFSSVPWHPTVFTLPLDGFIFILSLFGFKRSWQKEPIYILWFVIGMFFLLIWPTKWPQYILMVAAPLMMIAAEGVDYLILSPIRESWDNRNKEVYKGPTFH
jgi:4-amino-4-deoxy-L-arabinose transferase-like glycosyltransferase